MTDLLQVLLIVGAIVSLCWLGWNVGKAPIDHEPRPGRDFEPPD